MKTRVPFDKNYVALVGTAVYVFSYYEWAIIYIIERLKSGFVAEYCRGTAMSSGKVLKRFNEALQHADDHNAGKSALECCSKEFADLIKKRNALIHAHPITNIDGAQILNYQANPSKSISDMKWTNNEIERFIKEIDIAACRAGKLLYQIKT